MRPSRDELRGKAQTVLGLIDPAELGPTLMHEHLLWDIRTPAMKADPDPQLPPHLRGHGHRGIARHGRRRRPHCGGAQLRRP
jgi:hypothetical protein